MISSRLRKCICTYLLIISSSISFLGAFIMVMDNIDPIRSVISNSKKWKNIAIAINDLNTFDDLPSYNEQSDKVGFVFVGETGFNELLTIINKNTENLDAENIIGIGLNAPIDIGGFKFKVIHVAFLNNNNAESLTSEYIFNEWIRQYRQDYYINIGLWFVVIGFLISIIGHVIQRQ